MEPQGGNSAFEKKDKHSKNVQKNFSEFWEKFIMYAPEVRTPTASLFFVLSPTSLALFCGPDRMCYISGQAELRNLDEHPLVPWIHCLSSAPVKVFRLVAATAGLELLVALANKNAEVLNSMTNVERLYEAAW